MSEPFAGHGPLQVEVDDNAAFGRIWPRVQQGVLAVLVLGMAGALVGLLGPGPLSKANASFGALPLTLHYNRVQRLDAPGRMTLDIDRAYPAPELAVGIDRALLDGAGVSGTMPQATSATPTAEGVVYLLALGPERRGKIVFNLEPTRPGLLHGHVTVAGRRVELSQFVWP